MRWFLVLCRKKLELRHRYEENIFSIYDPEKNVDIDGNEFVEVNDDDTQNEMYNCRDEKVENMDYDAFLNYKYVSYTLHWTNETDYA